MDHTGEFSDRFAPVALLRNLGAATVVFVSGDIDALTAPEFRNAILVAAHSRPRALVVDLTEVDFFGAAGLEVLVAAGSAAREIPVAVVADGSVTRRPIQLTGVDKFVSVYPTLAGALDATPFTSHSGRPITNSR